MTTKLFPSDPLFWAMVNSERREVKQYSELFPFSKMSPFIMSGRRDMLRIFGYGWMVQERKNNSLTDEMESILEDVLKDNGLPIGKSPELWQRLQESDDFTDTIHRIANLHYGELKEADEGYRDTEGSVM